jgi:SseB protein N-terminal domain
MRAVSSTGMSRYLSPGGQQFRDDHGSADPGLAVALAAYQEGRGSEQAALTALTAARLLVPVVAQKSSQDSEMVLPTLIGRDGRPALPAFTCTEALARWRKDARPVPAESGRVWQTAVADGCAVVIDVAGPVPLAVEGARLTALAEGRPVPAPHEDPDIRSAIADALADEPGIDGFTLAPSQQSQQSQLGDGDGGDGGGGVTDLTVILRPAAGADWRQAVSRAANSIASRLAPRLRRGIDFGVTIGS